MNLGIAEKPPAAYPRSVILAAGIVLFWGVIEFITILVSLAGGTINQGVSILIFLVSGALVLIWSLKMPRADSARGRPESGEFNFLVWLIIGAATLLYLLL